MSIGDNIRKIRQAKGLTQAQLAQLLKTTPQNLNQYENGKRNPKHETIIKIADALQIPVSDLLPEDTQRGIIDFFSGADAFKQKYSEGISVEGIIDNSENISRRISLKEKLLKRYQDALDSVLSDINYLQAEANDLQSRIDTLNKEITKLKKNE